MDAKAGSAPASTHTSGEQGKGGETPNVLPRPDFHFSGEVGRTYLESDPPTFPQPGQAPRGAPNILLILIDDCGFGQKGRTSVTAPRAIRRRRATRLACPNHTTSSKSPGFQLPSNAAASGP